MHLQELVGCVPVMSVKGMLAQGRTHFSAVVFQSAGAWQEQEVGVGLLVLVFASGILEQLT